MEPVIQKFHAGACITWLKAFSPKVRATEQCVGPTLVAEITSGCPYQADGFWLSAQGVSKSELPPLIFLTSDKYLPYPRHTQDSWHAKEDTFVLGWLIQFVCYVFFFTSTKKISCRSHGISTELVQHAGGTQACPNSWGDLPSSPHLWEEPAMTRAKSSFLLFWGISIRQLNSSY